VALVRVVIPTYNRATSVCAALHSVRQQTFTDVEIVVADDGSADDTIEQVGDMARADSRIRVLRLAHGGVAKARNAGIDAPGSFEYVAFLDADDLWRPDHLASCIPLMQRRTDVTLMYGAFETIDYTGTWTAQEFADRQRRIGNATRVSAQKEGGSIYVLEPAALLSAFLRFEIFPLTSTTVIRRASVGAGP
jgi:glycosyltransferase involved in cell wall biosynthesis